MKDQAVDRYNTGKGRSSSIVARSCRNSICESSAAKGSAEILASDIRIDKARPTPLPPPSFPAAFTAARNNNINVHVVHHHFPSPSLSFVESLPLVGHVSHINVPNSTNDGLEPSCEGTSTSKAIHDVHISARLMEEFMELANANTQKNLETCGILGAFLKNQTFYVTTLIIPKQESTSNSCQALNEEEIHAIQDGQSLFPVGWIHVDRTTLNTDTSLSDLFPLISRSAYTIFLPGHAARGNCYCYGSNRSYKELWDLPADRPRRDQSSERMPREWGIPPPPRNLS